MPKPFRDRADAGQRLAALLHAYANRPDVVVLALPRGGVPVAYEIAEALHAPLDVFVVRKIGVPGQEELALGAIASGGVRVFNENIRQALHAPEDIIEELSDREQRTIERCERIYRGNWPPLVATGKIAILVDDGLATGASMRAAISALRQQNPGKIIVAVPTAAPQICAALRTEVDDIICVITPEPFVAVGLWYRNFTQITDQQVRDLLKRSRHMELKL